MGDGGHRDPPVVMRIVAGLPRDLPAAVFVSLHFPPRGISVLPQILSRAGTLPAMHPTDEK